MADKVTTELNLHLNTPVSSKIVRFKLHKTGIRGRVAIFEQLVTYKNAENRRAWCNADINGTLEEWQCLVWSDESPFILFLTT